MILSNVSRWCCTILHNICTFSERYFKTVCKTGCLFYKLFCYVEVITQKAFPTCNLKDYSNFIFKGVSQPSCNITHDQLPRDNSLVITDIYKTDFDKLPKKLIVFPSLKILSKENIYSYWCMIFDHTNYWVKKIYEEWCVIADCAKKNMQLKPDFDIVSNGSKSGFLSWLLGNKTNYVKSENLKFLATGCAIGGIAVSIYLVYTRKSGKHNKFDFDEKATLNCEDTQKFIQLIETLNDEYLQLKSRIDEDKSKSTQTIDELQLQINQIYNENIIKENECQNRFTEQLAINKKLEQYVFELRQKCSNYQNEVAVLQNEVEKYKETSNNEMELCMKLTKERNEVQEKLRMYENHIQKLEYEIQNTHPLHENNDKFIDKSKIRKEDNNYTNVSTTLMDDPYVIKSLKKIEDIFRTTKELEDSIEKFTGKNTDKDYLHFKEILIRNTVELDNVESEGHLIIRNRRKNVLGYVYECLDLLKNKASD